jgi:hypothetical protein
MKKMRVRGIRIRRFLNDFPNLSNAEIAEMVGPGCKSTHVNDVRMNAARRVGAAKERIRESWKPEQKKITTNTLPWSSRCLHALGAHCFAVTRSKADQPCKPCHDHAFPGTEYVNRASLYLNSLAGKKRTYSVGGKKKAK